MIDPQTLPMRHVRHVYLVGIAGAGMSGIAEVLVNLGYRVSGSDLRASAMTRRLGRLGVNVFPGHRAGQIAACDVVVYSSAIPADNPELQEARRRRVPLVRRAEMLAELMRFSQGIAVAGTHGKTTTTSLLASILAQGGLDPTYVVGGLLNSTGSHARLGRGDFFIAEADESDNSFLHLTPVLAVVTSVDRDHLDSYGGDYQQLCGQFLKFIDSLPFYGLLVACSDDPGVRAILPRVERPILRYSMQQEADYTGEILAQEGIRGRLRVTRRGQPLLEAEASLLGRHNMANALAAIAVADALGVESECIIRALGEFSGISRRGEVKGQLRIAGCSCLLIDDYAHHPTEIRAMLAAVQQAWPGRRQLVVYQPHRPSRLQNLFEDFCAVLSGIEVLLLFEVYAAGEPAIAGMDSRALCQAITRRAAQPPLLVEDRGQACARLEDLVREGDILLVLGAGDISALSEQLVQDYACHAA